MDMEIQVIAMVMATVVVTATVMEAMEAAVQSIQPPKVTAEEEGTVLLLAAGGRFVLLPSRKAILHILRLSIGRSAAVVDFFFCHSRSPHHFFFRLVTVYYISFRFFSSKSSK